MSLVVHTVDYCNPHVHGLVAIMTVLTGESRRVGIVQKEGRKRQKRQKGEERAVSPVIGDLFEEEGQN